MTIKYGQHLNNLYFSYPFFYIPKKRTTKYTQSTTFISGECTLIYPGAVLLLSTLSYVHFPTKDGVEYVIIELF